MYSSIQASSNRRPSKRRKTHPTITRKHAAEELHPVILSRKERLVNCCRVLYHCMRRIIFGVSDGYGKLALAKLIFAKAGDFFLPCVGLLHANVCVMWVNFIIQIFDWTTW